MHLAGPLIWGPRGGRLGTFRSRRGAGPGAGGRAPGARPQPRAQGPGIPLVLGCCPLALPSRLQPRPGEGPGWARRSCVRLRKPGCQVAKVSPDPPAGSGCRRRAPGFSWSGTPGCQPSAPCPGPATSPWPESPQQLQGAQTGTYAHPTPSTPPGLPEKERRAPDPSQGLLVRIQS